MGISDDELNEIKSALRAAQKNLSTLDDRFALENFRTKKAADFFNDKAQREPEKADHLLVLSRRFEQAAIVSETLRRENRNARPEEEPVLRRFDNALREIGQQGFEEITAYAFSHIGEFVNDDPDRWQRMEKNSPKLVEKIKNYAK